MMISSEPNETRDADEKSLRIRLVLAFGGLAFFGLMGLGLEGLHAYKVTAYLSPEWEVRRLLLRLAHTHGSLLSLVQLGFAWTASRLGSHRLKGAGSLLTLGQLFLPLGFLLGALTAVPGDPGPVILLVPLGAVMMIVAAAQTAWVAFRTISRKNL